LRHARVTKGPEAPIWSTKNILTMHLKQICSPPILAVAEPSGANPVMIPSPWIRQCHRSMVSLQENYFICQETPPKTLPPSWLEVYPRKHILSEYWPIHITATVTVSTFNSHFPNEPGLTGFPQFSPYTCGPTCSGREPVRKNGPFLRAGCPSCHLI